ncbi:50S ribosome-binding GTPase [Kocuria palustris]|nr:50S ribosome-binding GTPase [Kocuria palustris]
MLRRGVPWRVAGLTPRPWLSRRWNLSYIEDIDGDDDTPEFRLDYLPESSYHLRFRDPEEPPRGTPALIKGPEGVLHYRDVGIDEYGFQEADMSLSDYFYGNPNHTHNVFYGTKMAMANQARKVEGRTFVDLRILRASSGAGGNGCISFFRDANAPTGPPDGGDGGDGGNVYILVVERNMGSLHRLTRTYTARPGTSGKGSQLDGKHGDDVIIEVPVGTTLRWIPDPFVLKKYLSRRENQAVEDVMMTLKTSGTGEIQMFRDDYAPGDGWLFSEYDDEYYRSKDYFDELNTKVKQYDEEVVGMEVTSDRFPMVGIDCSKPTTKPILLLSGGKGGLGNMHFLTLNIRNPRFAKRGRKGLTAYFLLELKLIADLGLVGLPNAGKLSLLRAISRARPRVGHWEFTTLQPTIGTIFTSIDLDPFTVADIPGIVRGALANRGMGLDFLRHIERLGGLVFVVLLESASPQADLQVLIDEVGPRRMKGKKVLVVATKADLLDDGANYQPLRAHVEAQGWQIVPVCAPEGHNIERCIRLMGDIARDHR